MTLWTPKEAKTSKLDPFYERETSDETFLVENRE